MAQAFLVLSVFFMVILLVGVWFSLRRKPMTDEQRKWAEFYKNDTTRWPNDLILFVEMRWNKYGPTEYVMERAIDDWVMTMPPEQVTGQPWSGETFVGVQGWHYTEFEDRLPTDKMMDETPAPSVWHGAEDYPKYRNGFKEWRN